MATKKNSKAVSAKNNKKTPHRTPARSPAKANKGKVTVKKPTASKTAPVTPQKAAKPASAKVVVPPKDLGKKIVKTVPPASKPSLAPKTVEKTSHKVEHKAPPRTEHKKDVHFNKVDLDQFKIELLAMRDRITGQSGSMRNAALQRNDEVNPEEDGTDAFMRLQTLEQVSSQHQIIANIDEALRAIEKGTYGVCDMCGELISKPRLAVLPFAKNCIKCQSEMENPRRAGRR